MHSIKKIYVNSNLIRNICVLRNVCALNGSDGKKTMWSTTKVCLHLFYKIFTFVSKWKYMCKFANICYKNFTTIKFSFFMRKPPDFRQMRRKQVRSSLYYYVCLTFEFDLQMESFCVLIESCEILSNFCSISHIQR